LRKAGQQHPGRGEKGGEKLAARGIHEAISCAWLNIIVSLYSVPRRDLIPVNGRTAGRGTKGSRRLFGAPGRKRVTDALLEPERPLLLISNCLD
jgi:hypothetical protein